MAHFGIARSPRFRKMGGPDRAMTVGLSCCTSLPCRFIMCEIYWKEYTNKKEGKSWWWHKKKNEDENTKEEEVDKTLGEDN